MPRMTKKEKVEWSLFLNPQTGRRTYNALCRKCLHDCKQSYRTVLVACPKFAVNSGRK